MSALMKRISLPDTSRQAEVRSCMEWMGVRLSARSSVAILRRERLSTTTTSWGEIREMQGSRPAAETVSAEYEDFH